MRRNSVIILKYVLVATLFLLAWRILVTVVGNEDPGADLGNELGMARAPKESHEALDGQEKLQVKDELRMPSNEDQVYMLFFEN